MRAEIKRKEILPQCFCVLTCLYYTLSGWRYSSNGRSVILISAIICAVINILKNIRANYIFFVPVLITIYKLSIYNDSRLLVALMAVSIGMTISFDRVVDTLLRTKCIVFVTAFLIGGYVHLNYLSMNLGVIMALTLYVYYPQNRIRALFYGLIILILGVLVSKSGSMLICGGTLLLLYAGQNRKIEQKILFSRGTYFLFPCVMLLNWLLAIIYAKCGYGSQKYVLLSKLIPEKYSSELLHFLNWINEFLSGRINLAAFSLEKFGVSFWGGNIDYAAKTGLPYFLVDSGMILLLQDWGLLITLGSMFVWILLMKNLVKKKNIRLIISAIMIALWSFNEDTLMSVGTNFLFYVIGNELVGFYKRKKMPNEDYRLICEVGRNCK